jgi:DNA (cytosine-5)-methyltransferase 1
MVVYYVVKYGLCMIVINDIVYRTESMKVISLFAGVGGICQGFKNAGFNVIWANEIDQNACITYKANHSSTILAEGDINYITTNQIPESDILTAGFPCQAFSIAGYRNGFNDERGNLFFSIIRILKEIKNKPQVIFLENVKNLISHDNGTTFQIIKNELQNLGYNLQYKILNTSEYSNIPQNRERIFIVGFLNKSINNNFIFPEKIALTNDISYCLEEGMVDKKYYYTKTSPYYHDLVNTVVSQNTTYQIRRIYIRENKSNLCPTLTANMGTGGHNVPIIKDKYGIRKLTPRECFNFQGFPRNFILPAVSNGHLYKQSGNAVSVSVVENIAINIKKALEGKVIPIKYRHVEQRIQQCLL